MSRIVYDLGNPHKRAALSTVQLVSAVLGTALIVMLLIFTAQAWREDGICNESASLVTANAVAFPNSTTNRFQTCNELCGSTPGGVEQECCIMGLQPASLDPLWTSPFDTPQTFSTDVGAQKSVSARVLRCDEPFRAQSPGGLEFVQGMCVCCTAGAQSFRNWWCGPGWSWNPACWGHDKESIPATCGIEGVLGLPPFINDSMGI